MYRTSVVLAIICLLSAGCLGQTSDDEPRLCTGMPSSQLAFAQALGSGRLQSIAYQVLKQIPDESERVKLYHRLFTPLPTSLLQLNGRIDEIVGAKPELASQIRNAINLEVANTLTLVRQNNIACSISLLSYREASDVFGKRIATQYGVVQVTIRNIDPDHEFLIHQVDFWFGDTLQYFATRDRKIARGVAEKGQAIDPRNLTIRIIETAANITVAATAPVGGDPQLGAALFNSTVVPGLKYILPDLTVPQIAKLDDMGFSAGATTMVLPKSGAISLVAFIPADSVMIPKLAQYKALLGANGGGANMAQQLEGCNQLRLDLANGTKSSTDAQQKIENCNDLLPATNRPAVQNLSPASVAPAVDKTKERRAFLPWQKRPKNIGEFDPAVLLLLQRDLNILVAGSHIQTVPTQAGVKTVSCVPDSPLVDKSVVTCTVSGTHLDLVKQAQLAGSTQSTELVGSAGIQQTKTDGTEIRISFPGCAFSGKVSTEYRLQWTDSRGVQQADTTPLQIWPAPSLSCISSGGKTYQCQLKDLKTPADSVELKDTSGKTVSRRLDTATPSLELDDGTYTVTVTPKTPPGGKLPLCAPVKVP